MTSTADLLTAVMIRELVAARRRGMRVLAVTSPMSLVAGLAARDRGAPDLALAAGFGVLDAVDPFPALSLGEASYGTDLAHISSSADTFIAVARGFVGVCTTPAQLDGRGAANLSRIGGTWERPGVALPGSRGLPDNNDMRGPVWYVYTAHDTRQLVAEVEFVSGPPPSAGRYRRLLTPLGVFELQPGRGWSTVSLHPGVGHDDVAAATGFPITRPQGDQPTAEPTPEERAVIESVDPHGLRALGYVDVDEATQLMSAAVTAERRKRGSA